MLREDSRVYGSCREAWQLLNLDLRWDWLAELPQPNMPFQPSGLDMLDMREHLMATQHVLRLAWRDYGYKVREWLEVASVDT